jgi:cysteinyl-tRNA synthetase
VKIYNTLTRQKEEFKPIKEGKVGMYACGVTVYDYCHLGHARALITFDIIYRYLKFKGYQVTFVRNFTDVDDKIINRAKERGIPYDQLTKEFIQAFKDDTCALGFERPTVEPKATEHIPEIIRVIENLEKRGLAYRAGGDVYFSVRDFKSYGKLSGKNIEDLESGARVDVNEAKKDPLDFALWKAAKPGEPHWPSPWGEGRPGWHIECSAMSMKYLGETFDIHGGGMDLIFPHHENERAQSEGATGKTFAKHWVHNGFVNIDAEKMSKSLGNFKTIRDILKKYPAEVIRLFIVNSHYRSPLDYTDQVVFDAVSGLERYYQTLARVGECTKSGPATTATSIAAQLKQACVDFEEAMDDDFNTAKVVGLVFEQVRTLNRLLDQNALSAKDALAFLELGKKIHSVLGVFGSDPEVFLNELKAKSLAQSAVSEEEILQKIAERKEARKNKDFKRADEIRKELQAKGVELKDNPDGSTTWTISG